MNYDTNDYRQFHNDLILQDSSIYYKEYFPFNIRKNIKFRERFSKNQKKLCIRLNKNKALRKKDFYKIHQKNSPFHSILDSINKVLFFRGFYFRDFRDEYHVRSDD